VVLGSLATPWYSTEVVFRAQVGQRPSIAHGTMSGFAAFSFVEAAVLVTALAVLVLTWARGTDRSFSLPGRDGTVVTAAAGWIGLLIVFRMFDRPNGSSTADSTTLVGLSWGLFASLAAVGLLLATGLAQRRAVPSRRESAAARADGPVVDPADVVPPDAGERDGDWTVGGTRDRSSDGRPRERRPEGEPPARPAWTPDRSDRRPAGHADDTRALGRDDAAALLRDAGLARDAPASTGAGAGEPTRAAPAPDAEAPTWAVRREDPAGAPPARRRDAADDATRVAPPRGPEDAPRTPPREPEDATRVQPREPEDETRSHRRRRRRER
jgi:hypothetical protein